MQLFTYMHRLFSAYEEEEGSSSEIVQVLEYLSGGQLFEKIIESSRGKQRLVTRTTYQLHNFILLLSSVVGPYLSFRHISYDSTNSGRFKYCRYR